VTHHSKRFLRQGILEWSSKSSKLDQVSAHPNSLSQIHLTKGKLTACQVDKCVYPFSNLYSTGAKVPRKRIGVPKKNIARWWRINPVTFVFA